MTHIPYSSARKLLALLAAIGAATVALGQTTFDWTGNTSGAWNTADNWNPAAGAPPGTDATDIARFNSASANSAISLGTATTIDNVQFAAGAGGYTLSGETLTLNGSTAVSNTSGALQTFSNQINLVAGTTINVSSGSVVTFASTIGRPSGTGGTINISGGGAVNFTGNFASFTLFQNLVVHEGSTATFNTTSHNGFNNYIANGGRLNINRLTGTGGIAMRLQGDGSEIYITDTLNLQTANLRFRGDSTNNKTLTFGADIAAGGTASYTGTVNFNDTAAGSNQTYRLHASADNTLNLSGAIVDANAPGTGTQVEITGPGVVRFSGATANTSVTPIVITTGATLELAQTAGVTAIGGGSVTLNDGGTLRLGSSDQIANSTSMSFAGGTFDIGQYSDTVGALSIGALGGTLSFGGEAGSITFASLTSITGTLLIEGWGEGATIFFTDGSGWDASALAQVSFLGYGAAQFDNLTGELYAIPEPATTAALFALAVLAGTLYLRRRRV